MRCKYCFYADITDNREVRSYGIMSEQTLENLIKKAFEYASGSATFAFQGGEPTLAGLNFYRKLLEFQKKYNVKNIPVQNAIQTNGYTIDEDWARFLAENKFLVGLSLDGTRDIHDSLRVDAAGKGTFSRVEKTARLFQKHGVEFNILCVVNNFIARSPKKVYDSLKKYGFIQFIPCLDSFDGEKKVFSLTPERYTEFLKVTFNEYYKDFCAGKPTSVRNFDNYIGMLLGRPPENCAMAGVCTCYTVIEGDGSVFPCDFYVLDEWKLGNINESSFEELICGDMAKKFVGVSTYRNEECKECYWYPLCRGGCRREREPIIDGTPSLNRFCECYKKFFDTCYPKMEEIAARIQRQYQK
jgi:uncharacterized protein